MSKKAFHIYNIIIFLLLFVLSGLALFGAGMSEGGVHSYMYFAVGLSFVIWGIYYILQFLRPNKAWRISWFLIMIIILFFWTTGLGAKVGQMIVG